MDLDALLRDARPDFEMSPRIEATLDQLVEHRASDRPGKRPRPVMIAGIAGSLAVLFAGGATAAVAAGLWHPSWYDAGSDWTTEVKTVQRVFTTEGVEHRCTVTFSLESTYNGKGTPEFQHALSYLRTLDPRTIKPTKSQVDDLINATWVGQGEKPAPPSRAWANQMIWLQDVSQAVAENMSSVGLDSARVRLSTTTANCDVTR